jgi:hypothetical protein
MLTTHPVFTISAERFCKCIYLILNDRIPWRACKPPGSQRCGWRQVWRSTPRQVYFAFQLSLISTDVLLRQAAEHRHRLEAWLLGKLERADDPLHLVVEPNAVELNAHDERPAASNNEQPSNHERFEPSLRTSLITTAAVLATSVPATSNAVLGAAELRLAGSPLAAVIHPTIPAAKHNGLVLKGLDICRWRAGQSWLIQW